MYLSAVIDLYSCSVIDWNLTNSLKVENSIILVKLNITVLKNLTLEMLP